MFAREAMGETGETEGRRGRRRGYRVLLLLASLGIAIGVGLYTPGAQATALSRLILAVFTISMLVSMATAVVLIPSPPDPRERARRLLSGAWRRDGDKGEDDSDSFPQQTDADGTSRRWGHRRES